MSYKLGIFEFDTEEEYRDAQKDYDRIKEIKEKCDLDDPATVRKLLFLIKNKKIVFKTKVGAAFVKVLIKKFEEQNGVSFVELSKPKQIAEKETVSNLGTVDNVEEIDSEESEESFEIPPIIVEASGFRNLLSIVFFIASFLIPYLMIVYRPFLNLYIKFEREVTFKGQYYDGDGADYRYATLLFAVLAFLTVFNALRIGISNLRKINKRQKKANEYIKAHISKEALEELEEEEADADTLATIRFVAGLVMFVLAIVCFPLFIAVVVILLIFVQLDKLKYLWKNRRALYLGILTGLGYLVMFGFASAVASIRDYKLEADAILPQIIVKAVASPIGLAVTVGMPIILLILMRKALKTQTYLSIRNIASYPIELAMFLLPFAAVALFAYARYYPSNGNGGRGNGGHGGNPNGGIGPQFVYAGNPPTIDVQGYDYWRNGKHIYVDPYPRTMPDASVWNNLNPPR